MESVAWGTVSKLLGRQANPLNFSLKVTIMTEQERELLNNLLANLVATPTTQKDFEADDLIRRALSRKPDATYLLVQRTLLQEIALKNAQSRIDALEQQLRQAQPISDTRTSDSGSFLGNSGNQPAPSARWSQSPPPSQNWNYQSVPPSTPQPNAFSGFLKSAATTAAGVAGGALLFQGLENLFDHRGGWQDQPQEIVENNYIESPTIADDYGDVPQDNFLAEDPSQFNPDDYQANQGFLDDNNFY
jgi:hypothetical protein